MYASKNLIPHEVGCEVLEDAKAGIFNSHMPVT
jgi:hypothetical protein